MGAKGALATITLQGGLLLNLTLAKLQKAPKEHSDQTLRGACSRSSQSLPEATSALHALPRLKRGTIDGK